MQYIDSVRARTYSVLACMYSRIRTLCHESGEGIIIIRFLQGINILQK